jgi:hypothetical protein
MLAMESPQPSLQPPSQSMPHSLNEFAIEQTRRTPDPWQNVNPWGGPATSPPLSVVERIRADNAAMGLVANVTLTPPPNQMNPPARS